MTAMTTYLEDDLLDHVLGTTALTMPTGSWIQLHTANPTESGAVAVAGETDRKDVTFSAASAGSATTSTAADWTSVSTTEDYTHFTIWDASTSGNCLIYGALTATVSVTAGDNFSIDAGSLTITAD